MIVGDYFETTVDFDAMVSGCDAMTGDFNAETDSCDSTTIDDDTIAGDHRCLRQQQ